MNENEKLALVALLASITNTLRAPTSNSKR